MASENIRPWGPGYERPRPRPRSLNLPFGDGSNHRYRDGGGSGPDHRRRPSPIPPHMPRFQYQHRKRPTNGYELQESAQEIITKLEVQLERERKRSSEVEYENIALRKELQESLNRRDTEIRKPSSAYHEEHVPPDPLLDNSKKMLAAKLRRVEAQRDSLLLELRQLENSVRDLHFVSEDQNSEALFDDNDESFEEDGFGGDCEDNFDAEGDELLDLVLGARRPTLHPRYSDGALLQRPGNEILASLYTSTASAPENGSLLASSRLSHPVIDDGATPKLKSDSYTTLRRDPTKLRPDRLYESDTLRVRTSSTLINAEPSRQPTTTPQIPSSTTARNPTPSSSSNVAPNHKQDEEQPFTSPKTLPRDPSMSLSSHTLEQVRFDVLNRLPIPQNYPEESLLPIILPSKMDLEGFLDLSTGSTRKILLDHRSFHAQEITWCSSRPYHGYIFEPRQVSRLSKLVDTHRSDKKKLRPPELLSVSTASSTSAASKTSSTTFSDESDDPQDHELATSISRRWAENRTSAPMRKRPVEVFYMQEADWFYVGQFKAYPLPDMTKEEFGELDASARDLLLRATVDKWPSASVGDDAHGRNEAVEQELIAMYEAGSLKIACIGLQCVGFNHALNRIMQEQSRRLKDTRIRIRGRASAPQHTDLEELAHDTGHQYADDDVPDTETELSDADD